MPPRSRSELATSSNLLRDIGALLDYLVAADLGLGVVDASIVALAEDLGVVRLATRDIRHLGAVKLRNGRRFELVVRPTRPDRR